MREGNRLEAKRAKGGLPHSLWETYSSFANTEGGLILLGVSEHEDHSLYITGVDDARNMAQDFWNMVHDPSKVSAVVLSDNDVVIRHTSQEMLFPSTFLVRRGTVFPCTWARIR